MSLFILSFRYLARRWGSAVLTVLTGALGLALLSTVMTMAEAVPAAAKKALGGADMVIGPKGSELDLVLCCALHITPTRGLVPYKAAEAAVSNPYVKQSVPIALGDSYNGTRILWTRPNITAIYGAHLSQGRMWTGAMQAVVGAEAAGRLHLHLGATMISTHGLDIGGELHTNAHYTVTGILAPTGTVIDRLILADLKSIRVVHVDTADPDEQGPAQVAGRGYDADGNPIAISAMVATFSSPIAAAIVPRQISTETDLTAANPLLEMARLSALARPGFELMLIFGAVFAAVAASMAAIGLISALNACARDLALLRILGASRWKVARVAVQEALILVHLAYAAGFVLALGLSVIVAGKLFDYGLFITPWANASTLVVLYLGALLAAVVASIVPVIRAVTADGEGALKA